MEEILFRGKSKRNNKWIYGNYICENNEIYISDGNKELVDKHTVGQYIGIRDINGDKIFEGDIVNRDRERTYLNYVIRYYAGSFGCERISDYKFYPFNGDSCLFQIVGNIYDDPEYLMCFD